MIPMPIKTSPNNGKNIGDPMDDAIIVQNTPKIVAATDETTPMAEGPLPGFMLLILHLFYL